MNKRSGRTGKEKINSYGWDVKRLPREKGICSIRYKALKSIRSIEKGTFKRKMCLGHKAENSKVKSYFFGTDGL